MSIGDEVNERLIAYIAERTTYTRPEIVRLLEIQVEFWETRLALLDAIADEDDA